MKGNLRKEIRNRIYNMIDSRRRDDIFKAARSKGCDIDGDVIVYKGVQYYIHIMDGIVCRVG